MTSSPSSTLGAVEGEYDLLQLLEEFSADDIADVVRAMNVDAGETLVQAQTGLPPSPSSSSSLAPCSSQAAAANIDNDDYVAPSSLIAVRQVPATTAQKSLKQQRQLSVVKKKPPAAAAATAVAKAKPLRRNDPNKARNERKEELIYLHKKVEELELQLMEIRRATSASSTSTSTTTVTLSLSSSSSGAFSSARPNGSSPSTDTNSTMAVCNANSAVASRVWKELADRQRTLRVKSEKENIRLRLVLETQLKIARSLKKTLLKPTSTKEIEKCLQDIPPSAFFSHQQHQASVISRSLPSRSSSNEVIFDELLGGVQRSYMEIDAVFEANGLARMESTRKDARMRRDPRTGGMYMEIFANKVLPFGIHETGDAVWHHFVFGKERIPHRLHTENAPKVFLPSISSYLKDFGLEVHAKHKSARFRVKQVLQQHIEEAKERIVIVWQARIDPVAFSDEPLLPDDVGFLEKGYIIMKRPLTLPGDLTLLQTCHHITPNPLGGNRDQHQGGEDGFARVGALTDFVLGATAANITTSYQIIEDVLLEQSRKRNNMG